MRMEKLWLFCLFTYVCVAWIYVIDPNAKVFYIRRIWEGEKQSEEKGCHKLKAHMPNRVIKM